MSLADSGVAKGVAVVGVAAFALYVLGTWDDKGGPAGEVAPVMPKVAPKAPQRAPPGSLRVPTELWGIALGDQFDKYVSSHGPFDKEKPPPGTAKKAAGDETYIQRKGQLRVGVRNGLVSSVAYGCKEGGDPTSMYKVACHAPAQHINTVFGDGVRVLCPKVRGNDANKELLPFVRAYDVVEYRTRYIVIKERMTGWVVYGPGELETLVGINWERCAAGSAAAR